MSLEKQSQFSSFKNLFAVFNKNKEQTTTTDFDRITNQMSELINNNMYDIVFQYLDSGYKLSEKQKNQLYIGLDSMHYSSRVMLFNTLIEKGMKLSDDLLLQQFATLTTAKSHYENATGKNKEQYFGKAFVIFANERLPYLNTDVIYQDIVKNIGSLHHTINGTVKSFLYGNSEKFRSQLCDKVTFPLKNYSDYLLKDKSMQEVLDIMNKLASMNKNLLNYRDKLKNIKVKDRWAKLRTIENSMSEIGSTIAVLQKIPETYYQNEIDNDKKSISILYSENEIDTLIAQENIEFNKKNNVKDLPKAAQEILDTIKNDYLLLSKRHKDLNDEEKFEVENLWSKRIVQIINNYLRAAPEFRTTMKNNNGQSIEDLLIDSLSNMSEKLKEINTNHSQNVLHDMSAMNRYTKSIKM